MFEKLPSGLKKILVFVVVAFLIAFNRKLGLDLTMEEILAIAGVGGTTILGIGAADFKKEAAKVVERAQDKLIAETVGMTPAQKAATLAAPPKA